VPQASSCRSSPVGILGASGRCEAKSVIAGLGPCHDRGREVGRGKGQPPVSISAISGFGMATCWRSCLAMPARKSGPASRSRTWEECAKGRKVLDTCGARGGHGQEARRRRAQTHSIMGIPVLIFGGMAVDAHPANPLQDCAICKRPGASSHACPVPQKVCVPSAAAPGTSRSSRASSCSRRNGLSVAQASSDRYGPGRLGRVNFPKIDLSPGLARSSTRSQ
jgi:hypothetical protein